MYESTLSHKPLRHCRSSSTQGLFCITSTPFTYTYTVVFTGIKRVQLRLGFLEALQALWKHGSSLRRARAIFAGGLGFARKVYCLWRGNA